MGLSCCVELATEPVNSLQTVRCGDGAETSSFWSRLGSSAALSGPSPSFFLTPSLLSRGVRGSSCKLACHG